jgi:hypothetical protein
LPEISPNPSALLILELRWQVAAGIIGDDEYLHDLGMLLFGVEPDLLLIPISRAADSLPPSAGGFFISTHR